jgi:hypothetical protein
MDARSELKTGWSPADTALKAIFEIVEETRLQEAAGETRGRTERAGPRKRGPARRREEG